MAGAVLEAQDHQDLPLERLATELNLARELGHNPLFQVSFAFDNTPVPKVALKDLTIEAIEAETTTAMFDLAVDIVDSADGLSISFEYNTDLFFRSTIERLAAHYAVLLDSIVAAPEARIGDLAVLPETERCALLAAGNGAAAASLAAWQARSASTVVALAEDSAARFPDQPALIEGETRLTYRELNLRANRLAHRLIGLGAGPEAAVAVYARRSIELTVAILAVSKTGAAYVALDPDYPHERLMHALLSWSGDQERTATIMRRALPPVVGFLTPESDCYNETLAPRDPARCAPGALPLADLIGVTDAAKGAEHADQGIISSTGRPRGSNAWAVGAAKTRDGRAILANDMHLELSVPNIWYRAELRYPGATLSGLTLPGFPLLIAGTNGHLAWRLTSIEGDFVDLVTIEEDSRDRNQYRTPAGLLPFETRSEAIHVRGGADETLRVRTTIWGPVLPKTLLGRLVAAHWTALDPVSTDLSLVDPASITSVTSAIALFNRAGGPPLNVLLADRSGKIAWTYMGGILHMPGGQSGQTGSRHFSDQQESWVEGQPSRFSSDAFVHRLTLKPPPSGL